ncbi:hypothetical protein C4D60_Mb05t01080 [Musa balbisiana]|uniref:Uncharacterized protein n=1 Tax=Musa balbisiana TaxID=52838 RepID=A0A4S8JSU6_MUSBA|nr:hypothetical protein C4D60_Mb05t01080 [Musa balbisiana]
MMTGRDGKEEEIVAEKRGCSGSGGRVCVWRTYLYCKREDERERRGRLRSVLESEFLSLVRNAVIYCVMMLLEQSQDFAAEILGHMV